MAEQDAIQIDQAATEKAENRKKLIKKIVIGVVVVIVLWFLYKKFVK